MAVDNSTILLKLEKSEAYFAEEIDKIYQAELLGIDLDCKKDKFLDCIFSLITALRFRIDRGIYDDTSIDLYNKLERELPFDLYDVVFDPNYVSIIVVIISGDSNFKTFLSLLDTPDTYSGQANKLVSVKSDESGLQFVSISIPDDSNLVHKTGNETINGIKTFVSSPLIPNATSNNQAVALGQLSNYVTLDTVQTITADKTFNSAIIINNPLDTALHASGYILFDGGGEFDIQKNMHIGSGFETSYYSGVGDVPHNIRNSSTGLLISTNVGGGGGYISIDGTNIKDDDGLFFLKGTSSTPYISTPSDVSFIIV